MTLRFAKYEGLGNDFIVVDLKQGETQVSTQAASALCDRHRGIGADGVLLVSTHEAAPRMRVINADGSQPEMCGNGLRCVALHLVRRGAAPVGRDFVVETDAGPHVCLVVSSERESTVRVNMRPAELAPSAVPVVAATSEARVLDQAFEVSDTQVRLSCVSMGNPHAVTFDDLGTSTRMALAPQLEKHARFPRAANIGFARVIGPQQLELAVWERGVGFTEACGTGACACAVAAVETERAERFRPIEVRLPGGPLQIVVGERDASISMSGPARHVYDGTMLI